MRFIFIIIVAALSALSIDASASTVPSDSGSVQYVGNQTITFIDSARNNRSIQSLVYYPATAEGTNAPILLSGIRYPIISFGHGFTINPNIYIHLYRHLASWGYIVIAPATETGFSPSHTEFAKDLVFVIKDMKRRSVLPSDFFLNSADTNQTGVFGHSMGAGCSFLAGSFDNSIKAVSSLAAANTNPSSITAIGLIQRPVQLLSGGRDSIASYWSQQLPHYNNANPYRQIINIKGGNHSYFRLLPSLDDLVDNTATITRAEQQRYTRRYVTAFFNVFLKNDTNYKTYLYGNLAQADTGVVMQYELPSVTGINENGNGSIKYGLMQNYPNPFNPETRIVYDVAKAGNVRLTIFDVLGRKAATPVEGYHMPGRYSAVWNAENGRGVYPAGVYFYRLETDGFSETKVMILKK